MTLIAGRPRRPSAGIEAKGAMTEEGTRRRKLGTFDGKSAADVLGKTALPLAWEAS